MMKEMCKTLRMRIGVILLCATLFGGAFLAYIAPLPAAADEVEPLTPVGENTTDDEDPEEPQPGDELYNTKTIYHWTRVYYQEDIPTNERVQVMFCWAYNGVAYCNVGDNYYGIGSTGVRMDTDLYLDSAMLSYADDEEEQKWADEFETENKKNSWSLEVAGSTGYYKTYAKDGSGKVNTTTVYLYRANGELMYADPDWSGNDPEFGYSSGFPDLRIDDIRPMIVTAYTDADETDYVPYGFVQPIYGRDGGAIDFRLFHQKDQFRLDNYGSAFDYGDENGAFVMYIGRPVTKMAIRDDYTVTSGNTLQLKADCFLDNGVTLTIEPGAVVSLAGEFYDNGYIKNYGTLVLYSGATMHYFDPEHKDATSIYNFGSDIQYECKETKEVMPGEGNLLIMEDARLILPNATVTDKGVPTGPVLSFTAGATLYNRGYVVSPFRTEFKDAHIYLGDPGVIYTRKNIKKGFATLDKFNVEDAKKVYKIVDAANAPDVTFTKPNTYIEYYGRWMDLSADDLSAKPTVDVYHPREYAEQTEPGEK